MTEKASAQFKFVPFALAISGAMILVLLLLGSGHDRSFPSLTPGSFMGRLSGISADPADMRTLYVERIGNLDSLLIVVFKEGWEPQIVSLSMIKPPSEEGEPALFAPVTVRGPDGEYVLHGSAAAGRYSGELLMNGETRGTWSLTPADDPSLRQDLLKDAPVNIYTWLTLKQQYRELRREKAALDEIVAERQDRIDKLNQYVAEESSLRKRADLRRDELESQVAEQTKSQEELERRLETHVRELDQLQRITKLGRAIDLARRVAKREDQWYLVNWQEGEDLSGLEESLAAEMKIDLKKLEQSLKSAEEYVRLKNAAADEREKVILLQKRYRQKLDDTLERQQRPTEPSDEKRKDGPWWKQWDAVFG